MVRSQQVSGENDETADVGASRRGWLTWIVAALMIVFGAAEVVTGVRHEFFGLVTSADAASTAIGVALGSCYIAAGVLVLTNTRAALYAAAILLLVDIVGRLVMTFSGLYPTNTTQQLFGIIAGTVVAVAFLVIVLFKVRRTPSRT